MKINKIVSDYYRNTLFAFLPNICNSSCDFCYVEPLVGSKGNLSPQVIENFKKLITQAKKIGFKTIRITGGEPLIFRNIAELINILKNQNLNYTLITNGQNLHKFLDVISSYPPKKITISLHSIKNYKSIFKNEIDFEVLFNSLSRLKENSNTEIITTVVYLPQNSDEILDLIELFETKDIDGTKVIFPNNYLFENYYKEKFKGLKISSSKMEIRKSDFTQKKCLLNDRGFLSIVVGSLETYNCCTTVGELENRIEIEKTFNLKKIVIQQHKENKNLRGFPCQTNLSFCPIALTNVGPVELEHATNL